MRRSTDFSSVVRDGRRVRHGHLVVHFSQQPPAAVTVDPVAAPLVGLVVSKSVGNSVLRHRVSRRLRAQLDLRLDRLPAGSRTVVRALPQASEATSAQLGLDLDRALARTAHR
jgi:ribonuclease P protein component